MKLQLTRWVLLPGWRDGSSVRKVNDNQYGEVLIVSNWMACGLLQRYGGFSCINSAATASCTSLHSEQILYWVIKSGAQVTVHKPKQNPLLQTLASQIWNFDTRQSSGQLSAEAGSESSATWDRFYLGSADNIAAFRGRREGLGRATGTAGGTGPSAKPGHRDAQASVRLPPPLGMTAELLFGTVLSHHRAL